MVTKSLYQCDETKPVCLRCTKSGRLCVEREATDQASFTIHVENRYASGKAKRPRGPRSSLTIFSPKVDLQTRALTYYLQEHFQAFPGPNIWGGISECISIWKVSNRTCIMVELALSSMALAVFSRAKQHPPAATEATLKYHRLLQIAREKIALVGTSASDGRELDAYLLSVSLMNRYECAELIKESTTKKHCSTWGPHWSHHDGAMAILQFWHDSESQSTPPKIIKHARRDLIKIFLLRNLPLPDWVLDGERFGETGCELEYDRVLVRLVNLHHASQHNEFPEPESAERMSTEARELDDELQHWSTKIPSSGAYQEHSLTEPHTWPSDYFYSSQVFSYSTLGHAAAWSEYFATKLLINSTRLKIINASRPDPRVWVTHQMQRVNCIKQMKSAADGLAATIPFCIGRFKVQPPTSDEQPLPIELNEDQQIKPHLANLVVWPLTVASSIGGIDPKQRQWFRSELASIGRITGNGGLEFAETASWGTF